MIDSFMGEYRFLANFYPSIVYLDKEEYPSVEHAFQAAKIVMPALRAPIRTAKTPGEAKKLGRTVSIRSDWEDTKEEYMGMLLMQKFAMHPELKIQLLATGNEELKEGNYWHDNYWGSCTCTRCGDKGKNRLGFLLMEVRKELKMRQDPMRIGIIGTAGRMEDGPKMNKLLYSKMVQKAWDLIGPLKEGKEITVVSGGAAWSDHVAVTLFKMHLADKLEIHLPSNEKHLSIMRRYHAQFGAKMGADTLSSLNAVLLSKGVTYTKEGTFFDRNLRVGKVDILIAFTWGSDPNVPKDGGTKHTWDHSPASKKIHVPLSTL